MNFKLMCSKKNNKELEKKFKEVGLNIHNDGAFVISENRKNNDHIVGYSDDTMMILKNEMIEYIESFGKDVYAYVEHNVKAFRIDEKLYGIEQHFHDKGFVRVNKSQIVNIRHIKEITPWFGQKYLIVMKNGKSLDVNRSYYVGFKSYIGI